MQSSVEVASICAAIKLMAERTASFWKVLSPSDKLQYTQLSFYKECLCWRKAWSHTIINNTMCPTLKVSLGSTGHSLMKGGNKWKYVLWCKGDLCAVNMVAVQFILIHLNLNNIRQKAIFFKQYNVMRPLILHAHTNMLWCCYMYGYGCNTELGSEPCSATETPVYTMHCKKRWGKYAITNSFHAMWCYTPEWRDSSRVATASERKKTGEI